MLTQLKQEGSLPPLSPDPTRTHSLLLRPLVRMSSSSYLLPPLIEPIPQHPTSPVVWLLSAPPDVLAPCFPEKYQDDLQTYPASPVGSFPLGSSPPHIGDTSTVVLHPQQATENDHDVPNPTISGETTAMPFPTSLAAQSDWIEENSDFVQEISREVLIYFSVRSRGVRVSNVCLQDIVDNREQYIRKITDHTDFFFRPPQRWPRGAIYRTYSRPRIPRRQAVRFLHCIETEVASVSRWLIYNWFRIEKKKPVAQRRLPYLEATPTPRPWAQWSSEEDEDVELAPIQRAQVAARTSEIATTLRHLIQETITPVTPAPSSGGASVNGGAPITTACASTQAGSSLPSLVGSASRASPVQEEDPHGHFGFTRPSPNRFEWLDHELLAGIREREAPIQAPTLSHLRIGNLAVFPAGRILTTDPRTGRISSESFTVGSYAIDLNDIQPAPNAFSAPTPPGIEHYWAWETPGRHHVQIPLVLPLARAVRETTHTDFNPRMVCWLDIAYETTAQGTLLLQDVLMTDMRLLHY